MRYPLIVSILVLAANSANADSATDQTQAVLGENGAAVYQHVCQGCHMPGARGAVGAGRYPALANDARLSSAGYLVSMVLNGHGGMPWFNGVLSDVQIADVVNYVRTNFGNTYTDAVTPADIAAVRGPAPTLER